MAIVLPKTLQAGTPENVNDVRENFTTIEDALNALGGDLGGTIDDATVGDLAVGGDLSGTLSAANVTKVSSQNYLPVGLVQGGAIHSFSQTSFLGYANYNVATDRLKDATKPGWRWYLDASATDRFVIQRAPATAGAPVWADLFALDSSGNITAATISAADGSITYLKTATGATGLSVGCFSARRTSAFTVTSTPTAIAFDTEDFDLSSWYNTSNGRFTPQVAGYYELSAQVTYVVAATEVGTTMLRKNGSDHKLFGSLTPSVTTTISLGGSAIVVANGSTDYFDVTAASTPTSGPGVPAGGTDTYFQGHFIGRS